VEIGPIGRIGPINYRSLTTDGHSLHFDKQGDHDAKISSDAHSSSRSRR
jgi:hypothetical protein